jgi:hypothetical protein
MIVTLLRPHTDAGRQYQPGDTLDVDEATARWLIGHGVAEAAPEPKPKKPTRKGD